MLSQKKKIKNLSNQDPIVPTVVCPFVYWAIKIPIVSAVATLPTSEACVPLMVFLSVLVPPWVMLATVSALVVKTPVVGAIVLIMPFAKLDSPNKLLYALLFVPSIRVMYVPERLGFKRKPVGVATVEFNPFVVRVLEANLC